MKVGRLIRRQIREMNVVEYAPKKHEKYAADMSLNVNPYGISKNVMKKLASLQPDSVLHYYPESAALLEKISKYTGMDAGKILLGDGCDGCLAMIAGTFLNEGDEAIIPVPTFHRYEFHARCMGAKPVFVQMKNFSINAEDILSCVNDRTKMIFLCDPNNPTGLEIDGKIKEKIIKGFGGIVVIDEALADISGKNSLHLVDEYDNLVIARSFSKIFGLASLRIGYMVSGSEIISQVRKASSPFRVNGIAQELALAALDDVAHLRESMDFIGRNRGFLISSLKELGFKCTDSVTSNFLLDISPLKMDSTDFVDLLKKKGVAVTDGKPFRVQGNRYVRISVGTEKENRYFIEAMKKIAGNI